MNPNVNQLRSAQDAIKTRSAAGSWAQIFDLLRVARDTYRAEYPKLTEARDKRKQAVKQDFRPSSPRYKAEMDAADNAFDSDLEILRKKLRFEIEPEFAAARDEILTEAASLDSPLLDKLERISGFQMDKSEVLALAELYSGRSYWSDRVLRDLAQRNGVDLAGEGVRLQPGIGARLEILSELREQFEDLLTNFDGNGYKSMVILSDNRLKTAEARGTNFFFEDTRSDEQTAWRVIAEIRNETNLTERVNRLTNALHNASESVRERLLAVLSTSDWAADITACAGLTEAVSEWKSGKAERFFAADNLYDKAVIAGRESGDKAAADVLLSGSNNEYLKKKVARVAERDSHIRSIARLANEKSGESVFAVGTD